MHIKTNGDPQGRWWPDSYGIGHGIVGLRLEIWVPAVISCHCISVTVHLYSTVLLHVGSNVTCSLRLEKMLEKGKGKGGGVGRNCEER